MNWNDFTEDFAYLTEPRYLYLIGAAVLFFCFLVLLRKRQPRSVVAYTTPNGRVMVSRSAIIELVQTSCQQLNAVSKPQIKIKAKGKVTHFEVRIKLTSGGKLRHIESTLQSHLRRSLTENLGIENLGRIDITATGFKSGKISELPAQAQIPMDQPEFNESEDVEYPAIEDQIADSDLKK